MFTCAGAPIDVINTLNNSEQLFASKYLDYLPTEEELSAELERERAALKQFPDHD